MMKEEQKQKWRERAERYHAANREKVHERNRVHYHNKLKHDRDFLEHRKEYGKEYRETQKLASLEKYMITILCVI